MTDAYVDERTFYGTDSDKGYKLEKKSRRRRQLGTDEPLLLAPANGAPPPILSDLNCLFPCCDISARARPAREKRQGMRNEKMAALGQIFLPKRLVPLVQGCTLWELIMGNGRGKCSGKYTGEADSRAT